MAHRARFLLIAICSSLVALPAPAADHACATCDRVVVLAKKDAKCVDQRLSQQLTGTQDPILVPVDGCGAARDGSRQEMLPQTGHRNKAGPPQPVYLLTRPDAQCLHARLMALDSPDRVVTIDLGDCRK